MKMTRAQELVRGPVWRRAFAGPIVAWSFDPGEQAVAASDALTITGTFAGRYTIERELGRGGTAFVYLARDQRHGTPVAIKLLRADISETIGADRFLKEIRISAGLHHPHILPVLDSGEDEGRLFFVLPHAEGGTLRSRLAAEKQLPVAEVISITRTVAVALDHAHAKGLVHRDVKPENILFTSGQACLADFGIARALEHPVSESTTSAGIIRGTPAYMSPEQASGETALDGRSDLYSLACVTYEMLSGMQPFIGPTPQTVIAMRYTETPRSIRIFRPSLAPGIDAVLQRAMSVSPADRFQTGAEFATALDRATRQSDDAHGKPSFGGLRWKLAAAGAVVAGLAFALSVVIGSPDTADATSGIPEGDPRRVAVMYLEDLTPSTLPTHVADGITEDLIDQLGDVRALQVTSPYGVRPFRAGSIGIDSIRRALKVGTIVTGSIARAGDSVRLNVRLVDAATSQQLATIPSIVVPLTEVFALGNDLAERVAFTLRQRIGDRVALRENRAATRSAAAWELTQRASGLVHRSLQTFSVPLMVEADSLYRRAANADRAWELPWIKRGAIGLTLGIRGAVPPPGMDSLRFAAMDRASRSEVWYARTISLADSALKRAPQSAQALAVRGEARYRMSLVRPNVDSNPALAEADLRAALELRPAGAAAWATLASLLLAQQRYPEAAEAAKRGYDADPFFESRRVLSSAVFTALYAGNFTDARRWCGIAKEHYASDPRFVECELTLLGWSGQTNAELQTAERLLGEIERSDTLRLVEDTRSYRRLMVAAVAARAGLPDSARRILAAIRTGLPADTVVQHTALGEGYVRLLVSDRDSSLAILDRYLRIAPHMRTDVARHPWFATLRKDPRFAALVEAAK